ncbi:ABC transporter permease subunit [candidate division KSB1 bacterium]
MILHIAKKDFLSNLISARFVIGFLLCLFLIPFTLMVSIDDYSEQLRVYAVDKAQTEKDFKEVKVYSKLRPEIVKPPEPLSIFSQGISSNVGNRVKIWLGEKPLLATGKTAIRDNPLLNSFFSIDFISIIAIIMSLLALIFTYDSCTGEKEEGTLKLQLSNSISRYKILLGKVIGVYLTLLPIILFCYILSFILILFSSDIEFSASDWGRICLLFLISILFLSVFIFIGLFISSRFRSSIISIIVCLFIWVFLIFIIPNLSVYIAESFVKFQSLDNLMYILSDLDKEFANKREEYRKTLDEPDWWSYPNQNLGRDGYEEIYGATKSLMENHRQRHEFNEPLRIDYADKKWAFQKAYLDELDNQKNLAEMISLISPSELFRLVCSAICRTDVHSNYRFMSRTRLYREEFINYLHDKKIFSSFLYFTQQPPETFMTADESVRIRSGGIFKNLKEYREWAKNHKGTMSPLRKVAIPAFSPKAYSYLDLSNVPMFQSQSADILADIRGIISKISILIILSIFLFYLSFISFIKYDVR